MNHQPTRNTHAMSSDFPTQPIAPTPAPWPDGIAIIGMSARFPGSGNVQEFWNRLLAGEILISDLSDDELRSAGVDPSALPASYIRRGNSIANADSLDADFFGLNRREAEILDPQHRVFLECAWEALENAGYTGDGEPVGVFAGAGMNTYVLQLLSRPDILSSAGGYQLMLASDKDFLSTRVAYKLNLRGPAVTVQTACSTSLAAVHLACRSLLDGECTMALAGGVSISFPQPAGYPYIPGMILSPDGYCRPFDAQACGTVPGRGAGVVVLKRLSDALRDHDHVSAVIRGSAWNNDGAGKVGYTAPSVEGQADVIRAALAAAGISAACIGYVEAHGTATELGDPIEVAALASVFAEDAHPGRCVLGAVKGNMGHADVAAGVAGLIKAALAVESGVIPPTPNFKRPNPALSLETTPFTVSDRKMSWPGAEERWAGVSSFGIGGTNVHLVMSSAPAPAAGPDSTAHPRVFPVSARTATALAAASAQLARHLEADASLDPAKVASTLQLGRRGFAFRRGVVAETCAEAAALLRTPQRGRAAEGEDLSRDIVFLFPGQGQQFVGMAATLWREDRAFRKLLEDGCASLREHSGLDLLPFLEGVEASPALLGAMRETGVAQPLLFLVEYALAQRWRGLGAEPAALLGHSLGELTAATVAGVFSFADGLRLAAERGRLMARTAPGLMLAVMLPPEKLAHWLDNDVWLAAENGPRMSVASGSVAAVEAMERRLATERIASVRLASQNAFHTPLMAEAAKSFRAAVEAVPRHAPAIPWLSNVHGGWIDSTEVQTPRYWGEQILSRVRFTQNLALLAERRRVLLEVGPGEALIGMARQQMPSGVFVPSLGGENRRSSDQTIFLQAAARLWECGTSIAWNRIRPEEKPRRVPLPTYPFERRRYWIDPAPAPAAQRPENESAATSPSTPNLPDKRASIDSWFYAPSWQSTPPASLTRPAHAERCDCWLALLDDSSPGEALADRLRAQGATVISVRPGDGFSWRNESATIRPAVASDYDALWKQLAAAGLHPAGLLNLWPLQESEPSAFDSLMHLLRSATRHREHLRRVENVTASLESVTGESIVAPQRAQIHGLSRVIPLEYAGTEVRCIDVDPSASTPASLARDLLDELSTSGAGIFVAYRNGRRWQRGWTPAPLPPASQPPFRNRGVYLITGGAGGIGFAVAQHLLREHAARVVLTGRTALPSRDKWSLWRQAHGENDPVSRRIRRIEELETAGGEVLFVSADVADREAMANVLQMTLQRFGALHGVIHAAGLPGGSMIASQDLYEAAQIGQPKVQGSIILAELLAGRALDFFVLCSSISAVAPGATQAAYAAANAFQNTFAEYCRTAFALPATAVDFDAWQETGMIADAVLPQGLESLKEERLRTAMTSAEGIEVIHRVLAQWRGSQILTSTVDLDQLLASADYPAALSSNPTSAGAIPTEAIELTTLLDIWKELLAAEAIDPSDNFFSLGGHSLLGTMMIARVRDRLGVTITLRQIFETPTPAGLAQIVEAQRQTSREPALVAVAGSDDREEFEI